MLKNSKLSPYKIRKIMRHFCLDIDATKTAQLMSLNRKTVNRFYHLFRLSIYYHQAVEFTKLDGQVECDESYFGASRIRGFRGKSKRGRGTNKQPVFAILER